MEKNTWKTGMTQVADGVYAYITEGYTMMSNAALIIGERCAMVFDTLTSAKMGQDFYQACRKITDKPIRYAVFSHAHGDHFLGASAFDDVVQITHKCNRDFFQKEAEKGLNRWEGQLFPWVDFEGTWVREPDMYIDSDTQIDLGGRIVELKMTKRMHTACDIYAVIPDVNVICCGDLLFAGVCPNGLPQGFFAWIRLLKSFIDMDATYIPGHGPVCDKTLVIQSRNFLKNVVEGYMKLCNGKSLDQAIDELDWELYARSWIEPGRCYSDVDRLYAMMTNGSPTIPIDPALEKSLNEKIRSKYNCA